MAIYLYMLGFFMEDRFDAIYMDERLSQYKREGYWWLILISCIRWWSHWISHVVEAMAQYSASEELL